MTTTTTNRFGYEVRTRDGWSADAAGQQSPSNCYATAEEAEAGIGGLAEALGVSTDDVRVADLSCAWIVNASGNPVRLGGDSIA